MIQTPLPLGVLATMIILGETYILATPFLIL